MVCWQARFTPAWNELMTLGKFVGEGLERAEAERAALINGLEASLRSDISVFMVSYACTR